MFLGKRTRPTDFEPSSEELDIFQHRKRPKTNHVSAFPLSDDLLTNHLFNNSESFAKNLLEQTPAVQEEESKDSFVWKDEYLSEVEVDVSEALKDPFRSKHVKSFLKEEGSVNMEGGVYEKCMRELYRKINPEPEWWKKVVKRGQTHSIFASTRPLVEAERVQFTRVENLNSFEMPARRGEKQHITGLSFHPKRWLCAVVSTDNCVRVFKIDGEVNPLVQKFFNFKKAKVYDCQWVSGKEIVVTTQLGNKFFVCDVSTGKKSENFIMAGIQSKKWRERCCWKRVRVSKDGLFYAFFSGEPNHTTDGLIEIVSAKTKFSFTRLRTNSTVMDLRFDEDRVLCVTKKNVLHVWSLPKSGTMFNPIKAKVLLDQVETTRLAISNDHISVGCVSGVVSVYQKNDETFKVLKNIPTEVSILEYSHKGDLLAAGSSKLEDKLRMFVASKAYGCMDDFPNFGRTKRKDVLCRLAAFSHDDRWFAISMNRRIFLYRVDKL